jgi:hypothetical protein
VWGSVEELGEAWHRDRLFEPTVPEDVREERFAAWRRHLDAARDGGR